jgi:maleate isomerase
MSAAMPDLQPRRIGIIVPSPNRMVEQEMLRHLPAGTQAHVARLRMTGASWVPLDRLLPRVAEAAASLADAGCATVVFHCTASSMEQGLAGNDALLDAMRATVGAAVAETTASAMIAALAALGARQVVLVTPYSAEVTASACRFLEQAGMTVRGCVARDVAGKGPYWDIPPDRWLAELLAARDPDADAYVLSCANIACFDAIEAAEQALGVPVVTSNQAALWQALRAAGVPARLPGLGALGRQ